MQSTSPGSPNPSGGSEFHFRTLLAAATGLAYLLLCWNPTWMAYLGVGLIERWFLDTHSVLAASDAAALGIDPRFGNPLDFSGQPHAYSTWWYHLADLGLTRTDSLWVGGFLGAVFLVTAVMQLRVRRPAEFFWSAAFLLSPPVILGFCRGNADLLMFCLLSLSIACLSRGSLRLDIVASVLIAIATGLKFYPLIAGLLLLPSCLARRRTWLPAAVLAALSIVILFDQREHLHLYAAGKQPPTSLFTFGYALTAQWISPAVSSGALALALIASVAALGWRQMPRWRPGAKSAPEELRFILGATLLVACYVATVNYGYRALFALWLAPLLFRAWHDKSWPTAQRLLGRITGVLLLLFLWIDGLLCLAINLTGTFTTAQVDRWIETSLLLQQPLVATLMLCLIGFAAPLIRDRLPRLNPLARAVPVETTGNASPAA